MKCYKADVRITASILTGRNPRAKTGDFQDFSSMLS
jgi:hypothetical protein